MPTVRMPLPSLSYLTRFTDQPTTDAELLGRFVDDRNEEAFAELVRRHGTAVLAVCRRVTGNRDDADDAFQATFLVLARKAGRVRPGSALGGWLYGVAIRAARKALARSSRQRARETLVAEVPDMAVRPADGLDPEDTRAVLEAVAGLSVAYRTAVVLCELEGRSRAAAARELGIPEGTLSSRLAAARRVLAARLRDRGLGAAVLGAVASAATCPVLAAEARRLGLTSAFPTRDVEQLMEAVMQTKLRGWMLSTVAILVTTALVVAADPPPRAEPEAAPAPRVVAKADSSRLICVARGEAKYLTPDGRKVIRVTVDDLVDAGVDLPRLENGGDRILNVQGRATPDGRLLVAARNGFYLLDPGPPVVVWPVKLVGGDKVMQSGQEMPNIVAWSPDSRHAVAVREIHGFLGSTRYVHTRIDVRAGTQEELKLPRGHRVVDWSADGAWFLTLRFEERLGFGGWEEIRQSLCRVSRDGKEVKELTPLTHVSEAPTVDFAVFAPDGKRVAYIQNVVAFVTDEDGKKVGLFGLELVVLDLTTGVKRVVVSELGGERPGGIFAQNIPFGVRWAPDGDRLAYCFWHHEFGGRFVAEARVNVCRADGVGNRTVNADDLSKGNLGGSTLVDWR